MISIILITLLIVTNLKLSVGSIWAASLDGDEEDYVTGVAFDKDGNLAVVGYYGST